ncbi:MAG: hypothetical protein ACRES7_01020 [Gammaproteobacteria bacterium]
MNESDRFRWQAPQAWLYAYDFARDSAQFLTLERSILQQSSFLDQRIATDAAHPAEVPIAELLAGTHSDENTEPPHFIFHTAFCCSTLFARSLDWPGRSLVLREPATLLQLADLRRRRTTSVRSETELLPLTLNLLIRPFTTGERTIIKPTNLANNLAPALLGLHPASRALLLYDELEPFLLSVLKRPRESERGIQQFLARFLADPVGHAWAATNPVPEELAERAALAWTLQILELRAWLESTTRERVRVLTATELLADPVTVLQACAEWMDVALTRAEASGIAAGPLWMRHAKYPSLAYTPARRREEQTLARRLLDKPLHDGLDYARATFGIGTADFPFALLPWQFPAKPGG